MKNEIKSISYSKYRCQYTIMFVPKYRKKVIYKQWRRDIVQMKFVRRKKVEMIEAQACLKHIHILVGITPYRSDVGEVHWWHLTDMLIWNIDMKEETFGQEDIL